MLVPDNWSHKLQLFSKCAVHVRSENSFHWKNKGRKSSYKPGLICTDHGTNRLRKNPFLKTYPTGQNLWSARFISNAINIYSFSILGPVNKDHKIRAGLHIETRKNPSMQGEYGWSEKVSGQLFLVTRKTKVTYSRKQWSIIDEQWSFVSGKLIEVYCKLWRVRGKF